jgi:hypothetical protein
MRLSNNARQYSLAWVMPLAVSISLSGCGDTPKPDVAPQAAATNPGAASPPSSSPAAASSTAASSTAISTTVSPAKRGSAGRADAGKKRHGSEIPEAGSQARAPSNTDSISDAEAKEFFARFDKAITAGDATALGALIDYEAMIGRALAGLDLPEKIKESFVQGSKDSSSSQSAAGRLAGRVRQRGKYHLVKTHKKEGQQRALYHFFDAEGRVSFTDYLLARDAAGTIKVNDYYVYAFAERESDELRDDIQSQAAGQSPKYEKTLTAEDRARVQHRNEIIQIDKLIYDKKFHEAIELYDKLPDILRKCHNPLITRISACHAKKDQCDELVQLFRSKFPGDRGLKMWMSQYNIELGRWDEASKGVEDFDKELGGDPFLDADRAIIQFSLGNFAAAKKLIASAAAAEPDVAMVKHTQKLITDLDKELGGASSSDAAPPTAAGPAEAKAFAAEFVKLVTAGSDEAVGKCLDWASFFRRSTAKIEVPSEMRLSLEASYRKVESGNLVVHFHVGKEEIDKGASFALLRLHAKNGEHRALFRHVYSNGLYLYRDCVLVQNVEGKVRVADYLKLEDGIMRSEELSLSLADRVKRHKQSEDNDSNPQTEDTTSFEYFYTSVQNAVAQNRGQAALDMYNKLPTEWQKLQIILFLRVEAARQLKGELYDSAVLDYRTAFPDAANMDIIMINAYHEHKKYDRELTSIAALDESLGGDPYLDIVRAETYLVKHDFPGAHRCARKAIDADATLLQGYKILLTISLSQKKYPETSQLLTALKKQFPKLMPIVESDPEYAAYVKSPQYRTWVKAQGRKAS